MIGIGPGLGLLNRRRAAAFTGAYDDIPNITAAYGMRRLLTSYTGSLLRLRRSSDNAESDFGYTAAGDLDTAAIGAWLSGSGYIVTWYDQSGNGYDATQSTAANQPLYVASGQNGRPVGRWDGSNDYLVTTSVDFSGTNAIDAYLCKNLSSPAAVTRILIELSEDINNYTDSFVLAYSIAKFSVFCRGDVGDSIFGSTDPFTGWKVASSRWDKSLSSNETSIRANGVPVTGSYSSNANNTNNFGNRAIYIGMRGGVSFPFVGDIAELIICSAALSTGDRTAAEADVNSYWNIY